MPEDPQKNTVPPTTPDAEENAAGAASKNRLQEQGSKKDAPRTLGSHVREYAIIILAALVLSFLVKTFVTRAFYIPSGSMEQTLEVGDRVFVNKMIDKHSLKRGDIIVFHDGANWQPRTAQQNPLRTAAEWVGLFPADSSHFLVKRVIGLPGDRVKSTADGKISVNGKVIDEPYLYPGDKGTLISFDVTVPEGKLWVMGDHRSMSADSRYHMQESSKGFISEDDVEGTAWVRVWPLNSLGGVNDSQGAFDQVPASSGK